MNRIRAFLIFIVTTTLLTSVATGDGEKKKSERDLEFTTLKGKGIKPLVPGPAGVSVVIFITTDCPIANAYVPEINRIHDTYSKKGVRITLVHVDPDLTVAGAKAHAEDYALKPEIVIDPTHKLVAATRATITPEAAVIGKKGDRIYLGRINNRYTGFGDRRNTVTDHNLRDAIDAALAGKTVAKPKVEALGCFIPELD